MRTIISFDEIRDRIEKRFGKDAFIFNESDFVNTITKMHFKCAKCGNVLFRTPSEILRSNGCRKCNPITHSRSDVEKLLERFHATHGNTYDYTNIKKYIGVESKYPIVCMKHGVFWQNGYAHIHGQGCPKCKRERLKTPLKGVGINDSSEAVFCNGKVIPSYYIWSLMIGRCYGTQIGKNATYTDCTVCDEWLYFSNFKKWFDDPINGYREGYQLDKDILVKGNKIYSPDTCCFVPNLINSQIKKYKCKDNGCSAGIYFRKKDGKYLVSYTFDGQSNFLGVFDKLSDAKNAYKVEKERSIHNLARNLYETGQITVRVFDALMKYEITS